jgi:hypothetical protein
MGRTSLLKVTLLAGAECATACISRNAMTKRITQKDIPQGAEEEHGAAPPQPKRSHEDAGANLPSVFKEGWLHHQENGPVPQRCSRGGCHECRAASCATHQLKGPLRDILTNHPVRAVRGGCQSRAAPNKFSRSARNKDAARHHFINRPVCANKGTGAFSYGAASPPFKAGSIGLPDFYAGQQDSWGYSLKTEGSRHHARMTLQKKQEVTTLLYKKLKISAAKL